MGLGPALHRSQPQGRGDSLIFSFRPRRDWPSLAFFACWLTLWTFGGVMALASLWRETWSDRAFLGVWLCMWVIAETVVVTFVAWQLFGREELIVTPDCLEVRQRIGPLARVIRVPDALVDSVRASNAGNEGSGKVSGIEITAGDTKITVGTSLRPSEAEHVASIVGARGRPRPRWPDQPAEFGFGEHNRPASPDPDTLPLSWHYEVGRLRCPPRAAAIALAAVVVAVVAALFVHDRHRGPAGSPPQRSAFSDPRAYAAAVTIYMLGPGRTTLGAKPICGRHATWEHWTCHVTGPVRGGAYAGRELIYRCSASGAGIACGVKDPPPLTPTRRQSTEK